MSLAENGIPEIPTVSSTVISSNFLVLKFCGKAQFPYNLRRIAWNYAETVPFYKITRKLGEMSAFFAVIIIMFSNN